MRRKVKKAIRLAVVSKNSLKDDGFVKFTGRAYSKVYYKMNPSEKPRRMKDVLFIVGPHLPQVKRFRVDHQAEQLISNGMSADIISDEHLTLDDIKYYRGFIFCRYPFTDKAGEFIRTAKSFNKTIVFEIDDLVFDTNFTDRIKYIQEMTEEDKSLYDSGVKRNQQTLELCDYAITTTEPLKHELEKYENIKKVFVSRNVVSDEMVARSNQAIKSVVRGSDTVTLGYFSGSITHNEDFEMILPTIIALMKKYQNLRLHIGGILDPQHELSQFGDRITTTEFVDWRHLPEIIRRCDINLAPLAQKSIFNEAKSEIKWLDAALVKTVTVASNYGAFNTEIQDGETGVLVEEGQWQGVLEDLIENEHKRELIAKKAYDEAVNNRTTIATGKKLADWLMSIFAKNIAFVLPSSEISGGVNVVLKHADILRENGKDVTIINAVGKKDYNSNSRKLDGYNELLLHKSYIDQNIDEMVATLWATVKYVKNTPTAKVKSYFVQNFETDFLSPGDQSRLLANSTYCQRDLKYTTMSLWCKAWLKDKFGQTAKYASNGLWGERYTYQKRDFKNRKIRILIEGDPLSEWKNVDEAFRITNELDETKFEINFLSYYAEPKSWYRVDNFFQKVASEKVGEVYASNDILLKTSLLESFSYPPLEMIATGGFAVAIPNGGNLEYLVDEENCLMFESGDEKKAISQINRIVEDKQLRDKLNENGKKLAERYDWKNVEKEVLELYE